MIPHRDFRLLSYFVAIVRAGSIRGAASRLSVSSAVVSEALSELEANLGITLLQRSTRSMKLTEVGQRVFEHAAEMVAAAEAAMRVGLGASKMGSGAFRLTISSELCLSWLPSRLKAFEKTYPDIRVDIYIDDSPIDLVRSDFDIALRAQYQSHPNLSEDMLLALPLECVCAPALRQEDESLQATLGRIGIVGQPNSEHDYRQVKVLEKGAKGRIPKAIDVPCKIRSKDHVAAHQLAVQGFAAALLMAPTVSSDLAQGRLVRVSEAYDFGYAALSVLVRDKLPPAPVRKFVEHLQSVTTA